MDVNREFKLEILVVCSVLVESDEEVSRISLNLELVMLKIYRIYSIRLTMLWPVKSFSSKESKIHSLMTLVNNIPKVTLKLQ